MKEFILDCIFVLWTVFCIFTLVGTPVGILTGFAYNNCKADRLITMYNPGFKLGCLLVIKRWDK